jgi:PLP dependent protein
VRGRIEAAALRSNRDPAQITLVAVTKHVAPAQIAECLDAGVRDLGESYVQEAAAKQAHPSILQTDVRWHFIGHLQRNKAREVVGAFDLIHSVDSIELAREIGRQADKAGIEARILLQVKLDRSETKFGFAIENVCDAVEAATAISGVNVLGLMGMAPFSADPEASRPYFRSLSEAMRTLPADAARILSMGMSSDFEVAIEEGATMLRIGTAIFGPRPTQQSVNQGAAAEPA